MKAIISEIGGAGRDRTDDLIVANDALSQLSYSPTCAGGKKILSSAQIRSSFGVCEPLLHSVISSEADHETIRAVEKPCVW